MAVEECSWEVFKPLCLPIIVSCYLSFLLVSTDGFRYGKNVDLSGQWYRSFENMENTSYVVPVWYYLPWLFWEVGCLHLPIVWVSCFGLSLLRVNLWISIRRECGSGQSIISSCVELVKYVWWCRSLENMENTFETGGMRLAYSMLGILPTGTSTR